MKRFRTSLLRGLAAALVIAGPTLSIPSAPGVNIPVQCQEACVKETPIQVTPPLLRFGRDAVQGEVLTTESLKQEALGKKSYTPGTKLVRQTDCSIKREQVHPTVEADGPPQIVRGTLPYTVGGTPGNPPKRSDLPIIIRQKLKYSAMGCDGNQYHRYQMIEIEVMRPGSARPVEEPPPPWTQGDKESNPPCPSSPFTPEALADYDNPDNRQQPNLPDPTQVEFVAENIDFSHRKNGFLAYNQYGGVPDGQDERRFLQESIAAHLEGGNPESVVSGDMKRIASKWTGQIAVIEQHGQVSYLSGYAGNDPNASADHFTAEFEVMSYNDCPNKEEDDPATMVVAGVLSNEYTTAAMLQDAFATAWDFKGYFVQTAPGAHLDVYEHGTGVSFSKTKYKIRVPADLPRPYKAVWVEEFTPEDEDPDDGIEPEKEYELKSEQIQGAESAVHTIQPEDPAKQGSWSVYFLPITFDVYPPEPTPEEITEAGDDNWEVETFQIPDDYRDFWVQANVLVPGFDDEGNPATVWAEDGTVVKWEIVSGESDAGASLSQTTSEVEDGLASVRLTTTNHPGDRFKVKASITKLMLKMEEDGEVVTLEDADGMMDVKTQLFEVVPGHAENITLSGSGSLVADGKSEAQITATITDGQGKPAARGTAVEWRLKGSGKLKNQDFEIKGEDGIARATLVAGDLVGNQTVVAVVDGARKEKQVANTALAPSLTPADATLDPSQSETTSIVLSAPGVADGAEVSWMSTKGRILQESTKVSGGQATTTLQATGTEGPAKVTAVLGNSITSCQVTFTTTAAASVDSDHPLITYDASTSGTDTVPTVDGGTESVPYFATTPLHVKAPGHPGEWATIQFGGSGANLAVLYPFDTQTSNTSAGQGALPAILSGGAQVGSPPAQIAVGSGSLQLSSQTALATIGHASSLSLSSGSSISFWVRPEALEGKVLAKAGEYQFGFDSSGHLSFSFGAGSSQVTVVSAESLVEGQWHQVVGRVGAGMVTLEVDGLTTTGSYAGNYPSATASVVIGDFVGQFDDFRIIHPTVGLQGIVIVAQGLDSQNRIQLDSNGEATFTVSAAAASQPPPAETLAQTVDVNVSVGSTSEKTKEVFQVATKGTAVLIRAIAGKTAVIGTDLTNLDREEMAAQFLKRGVKDADRVGALPQDLGGDAQARGEAGYLIAIWMEESVDEAGMVRPVMQVSAQGLPPEIGDTLNSLLAQMMVDASHRHSTEMFSDYIIRNYKELLLALQSLSAGDIDSFLRLAKVTDGESGFDAAAGTAEQIGNGVVSRLVKDAGSSMADGYEVLRGLVNRQNWSWGLASLEEGGAELKSLQKEALAALQNGAAGSEEVLKHASSYLLQQGLIDEEATAAFGFVYGLAKEVKNTGDDLVQPELVAQSVVQLLDVAISAIGGDAPAKEALKNMGSQAVMTAVNTVPEAKTNWEQGRYFEAGVSSVGVVKVVLVAKTAKDILATATKSLNFGKFRKYRGVVGRNAEAFAIQRMRAKKFKDIIPIQNRSNHGIDFVCRDRHNNLVFVEVKGHRYEAAPRLSTSQADMEAFVRDRLEKAVAREGHWQNVPEDLSQKAQDLLDAMDSGTPFRGLVINVDYAISKQPRIRYYEWAKGLGPEINP